MTTSTKTNTLRKLQNIYVDTFSEKLATMRQYLAENDWTRIQRFGHQLKGSGKAYGFSDISDLGAKIETAADIQDGSAVRALQIELENVMMEISRQHQEERDGK